MPPLPAPSGPLQLPDFIPGEFRAAAGKALPHPPRASQERRVGEQGVRPWSRALSAEGLHAGYMKPSRSYLYRSLLSAPLANQRARSLDLQRQERFRAESRTRSPGPKAKLAPVRRHSYAPMCWPQARGEPPQPPALPRPTSRVSFAES